jgi:ABC-type nitrate/sulfonate/bicarbonate transport system permease component
MKSETKPEVPGPTSTANSLPATVGRPTSVWYRSLYQRKRPYVLTLASILIGLTIWHLLSTFIFNPFLIPPPSDVLLTGIHMLWSGEIVRDVRVSMVRVLVGFVLGSALAILIGIPMGRLRIVNELLDPIIELLRYLSPTAMIPIAVIWFGIGETAKYFLIFWGTFFIVLINAVAGVMHTPIARLRAAECLGANRAQIFIWIIIPSSVPHIVIGMRVAMASAFMSIIPAEILAADSGLGNLLQTSGLLLQTNRMFVALATISLLGFATDRLFRWAIDRLLRRYMGHAAFT